MAIPDAEFSAVRFSLCVVAERCILAKVSEEMKRKYRLRNTTVPFSTSYTTTMNTTMRSVTDGRTTVLYQEPIILRAVYDQLKGVAMKTPNLTF